MDGVEVLLGIVMAGVVAPGGSENEPTSLHNVHTCAKTLPYIKQSNGGFYKLGGPIFGALICYITIQYYYILHVILRDGSLFDGPGFCQPIHRGWVQVPYL